MNGRARSLLLEKTHPAIGRVTGSPVRPTRAAGIVAIVCAVNTISVRIMASPRRGTGIMVLSRRVPTHSMGYFRSGASERYRSGVSFQEATMVDTAGVALHGIELTGITPGGTVVVIGAGPIGIITMRLARILGAERSSPLIRVTEWRRAARLAADVAFDFKKEDSVKSGPGGNQMAWERTRSASVPVHRKPLRSRSGWSGKAGAFR